MEYNHFIYNKFVFMYMAIKASSYKYNATFDPNNKQNFINNEKLNLKALNNI